MSTLTKIEEEHIPHPTHSSDTPSPLISSSGFRSRNPLKLYFHQLKKRIPEEADELKNISEEEKHSIEEIFQQIIKLVELPLQKISLSEISQKLEELLMKHEFCAKKQFFFSQLTPRETEVLSKLAQGLSNKEVSEQLFISLDTVKHHRKLIKSKLKASSTVDFIKYAQAFDLI